MSTPPARLSVSAGLFVALLAVEEPVLGQMSAIEMHKRFVPPQTEGKATGAYEATGDDVQDLASVTTAPWRAIKERQIKEPTMKVREPAGAIKHMAMSGNGKFLTVVLADNSIRLWDLESGVQRPKIPSPSGKFLAAVPFSDGRTVIAGGDDGRIRVFQALNGAPPRVLSGHVGAIDALAVSEDGLLLVSGGNDRSVRLWDLKAFRQVRALSGAQGSMVSVAISPDKKRILTSSADHVVRLWDSASGKLLVASGKQGRRLLGAQFVRAGQEFAGLTDAGTLHLWKTSDGASIRQITLRGLAISCFAVDPSGQNALLGSENGLLRLVDLSAGRTVREFVGHTGTVNSIFYDLERRRIISAGTDGSMYLWDTQSSDRLLEVVMTAHGWVAIDPNGRFDASEQGMGDVSWQAGSADLPLDRFAKQFFEPGLLAYYLSTDSKPLAATPGKIKNGIALPPRIEIDMPDVVRDATKPFPPVTVVAEDQGGGIDTIHLYHNGKLVDPGAFLQQQDVEEPAGKRHLRVTAFFVKPVPGLNTFKAVGTGQWDIEGHSDKITATFSGRAPKSTLHIAVVGINKYRDAKLHLDYSVPDAIAMIASFTQAAKGDLDRVREYRLLDEEATEKNILEMLNDKIRGAATNDVVIVYLAGHGLVAQDEWRFLPYESPYYPDTARYAGKGITATEIQDALVKTKAQRILVFIDSCQSGAASQAFQEQQRFQQRYFRNVSRIAGITVLAATRKDQEAVEMRDLGHGLFTYLLLSGLKGNADLRPADGTVTAHELVGYAAQEIPDFSQRYLKYRQEPMAFALGADFPVSMTARAAP